MEFYKVIDSRRTVRDFTNEEIPNSTLERIIDAAFKAPTNDHMRDWDFILIKDKEVMQKALKTVPKGITNEELSFSGTTKPLEHCFLQMRDCKAMGFLRTSLNLKSTPENNSPTSAPRAFSRS